MNDDLEVMMSEEILAEFLEMTEDFLKGMGTLSEQEIENFIVMMKMVKFSYTANLNIQNLMQRFKDMNGIEE